MSHDERLLPYLLCKDGYELQSNSVKYLPTRQWRFKTFRLTIPRLTFRKPVWQRFRWVANTQAHIHYPNALLNIQANVFKKYHMTNVEVFYQNEDRWAIANDTHASEVVGIRATLS